MYHVLAESFRLSNRAESAERGIPMEWRAGGSAD